MTINVSIRQADESTPYSGLYIVTINGRDHAFPEPRSEAQDRVKRVQQVIERMRAEGKDDAAILAKYDA